MIGETCRRAQHIASALVSIEALFYSIVVRIFRRVFNVEVSLGDTVPEGCLGLRGLLHGNPPACRAGMLGSAVGAGGEDKTGGEAIGLHRRRQRRQDGKIHDAGNCGIRTAGLI